MRLSRPGQFAVDVAVCVAAALVTAAGTWERVAPWLPRGVIVPLAIWQGLFLFARRRAPAVVLAAVTLTGMFMLAVGYPGGAAIFAACCAACALAVHGRRAGGSEISGTLWGAAAVLSASAALAVAAAAPGARGHLGAWAAFSLGALVAASWVLGYALRTRRAYIEELKARAALLEAEEGERAARAVVDERLRIARELHDVIGHSISLITVQAEAAARCMRTDPGAVPGFLTRISAASRQALAEMRHVLAVLRPDGEPELGPAPGLADLRELAERLNAGGVQTRLDAEPMDLPPGVALTVYRIVQESLTNVLKHAGPGARAAVTVVRSGSSVRVSVHDDGAGPSGTPASTAHGIAGMCERAAVYGGTLRTGARAGGGFGVEALIPVREEAP